MLLRTLTLYQLQISTIDVMSLDIYNSNVCPACKLVHLVKGEDLYGGELGERN